MKDEVAVEAHRCLTEAGIDFVACMPDSAFLELYQRLEADSGIRYVQVANESDGVGICMGAWLGGARPALLMENTGFALSCYALLRGPAAFGIPMLLPHQLSWRLRRPALVLGTLRLGHRAAA